MIDTFFFTFFYFDGFFFSNLDWLGWPSHSRALVESISRFLGWVYNSLHVLKSGSLVLCELRESKSQLCGRGQGGASEKAGCCAMIASVANVTRVIAAYYEQSPRLVVLARILPRHFADDDLEFDQAPQTYQPRLSSAVSRDFLHTLWRGGNDLEKKFRLHYWFGYVFCVSRISPSAFGVDGDYGFLLPLTYPSKPGLACILWT